MSENQFFYNTIKQWNALPVEPQLPLPSDTFKQRNKKYLMSN